MCSAAGVASAVLHAANDEDGATLRKAMDSARDAIAKAAADPARPVYHFHPPAFWNNDPNGTIYYRGWHHLFYQFNPYGSLWGHMHWGHARSRDLVNWDHLPIAIAPSLEKGEKHVFSGGAILARDGRPRIIYTSIGDRDPEQWLASPLDEDLIRWQKSDRNPILTLAAHGILKVDDWRDPFMFIESGQTYMVCGGNTSGRRWGGGGAVQLYRAESGDLTAWKHLGTVFPYRNREVINVECPNLFQLDGKWVLIVSPHRPCEYFIGTLDVHAPRFEPETEGVLDAGDAYASNISVDPQGRTILWLWGRTQNPESKGWNGVMLLPRILSIGPDGFLRQQPAPEFETLRGTVVASNPLTLTARPAVLAGIRGDCLEMEVELAPGNASKAAIELRLPNADTPAVAISIGNDGLLSAGGAKTLVGQTDRYRLRIFIDKSVFEVYVNDGYAALYGDLSGGPGPLQAVASAQGEGARILSAKAWPLKPATFSLEHFVA
jgi:beta-fructofuranosidase